MSGALIRHDTCAALFFYIILERGAITDSMAEKNPFALPAKAAPARGAAPQRAAAAPRAAPAGPPPPPRVWSEEEIKQKLAGYILIPPHLWEQIRYGTHVRYFDKTRGFRSGGFVVRNPIESAKPGAAPKRYMKMQNGYNDKARGKHAEWLCCYDDIERIYVKPDATTLAILQTLEQAVAGLNANNRKLAEYAKKLEARVAALEQRR
jgi:hypothetical protein